MQVARGLLADDEPLVKRVVVLDRPGQEVVAGGFDLAVPLGDRGEHVGEAADGRPPELVRIVVDHPVGTVLDRGEPGHPRHAPALMVLVAVRVQDAHHSL